MPKGTTYYVFEVEFDRNLDTRHHICRGIKEACECAEKDVQREYEAYGNDSHPDIAIVRVERLYEVDD